MQLAVADAELELLLTCMLELRRRDAVRDPSFVFVDFIFVDVELKGRCAEALCEGAAGFQVACTLTASV